MKKMKKNYLLLLAFLFVSTTVLAQWTRVGSMSQGLDDESLYGRGPAISDDGTVYVAGGIGWYGTGGIYDRIGYGVAYELTGTDWTTIDDIIYGTQWHENVGASVDLSADGKTFAIGSPGYTYIPDGSTTGLFQQGRAQIFHNDAGTWNQVGGDILGQSEGDELGNSLSLSADGNIIAVSSPNAGYNGPVSGRVSVYHNESGSWSRIGDPIDGVPYGNPGFDIIGDVVLSSDGKYLAIVYTDFLKIYHNTADTWVHLGDISSLPNGSPYTSSIMGVDFNQDGSLIVVGETRADIGNPGHDGVVRVFEYNGSSWIQVGNAVRGNTSTSYLGYSAKLKSDGTMFAACDIDHVRFYTNVSGTWTETDSFSRMAPYAIDLSSDFSTVVVGEPLVGNGQISVYHRTSTGVYENEISSINVYPNPTHGDFIIESQEPVTQVEIHGVDGKLIREVKTSGISNRIDLQNEPDGIYFITIHTNEKVITKQIVKLVK